MAAHVWTSNKVGEEGIEEFRLIKDWTVISSVGMQVEETFLMARVEPY